MLGDLYDILTFCYWKYIRDHVATGDKRQLAYMQVSTDLHRLET